MGSRAGLWGTGPRGSLWSVLLWSERHVALRDIAPCRTDGSWPGPWLWRQRRPLCAGVLQYLQVCVKSVRATSEAAVFTHRAVGGGAGRRREPSHAPRVLSHKGGSRGGKLLSSEQAWHEFKEPGEHSDGMEAVTGRFKCVNGKGTAGCQLCTSGSSRSNGLFTGC